MCDMYKFQYNWLNYDYIINVILKVYEPCSMVDYSL